MSGRVLAIDPGTTQSAWVLLDDGRPTRFGIDPNEALLDVLRLASVGESYPVVIEKIASYGMAVGAEVFETVFWSGRFAEAAAPLPVIRIPRLEVKQHLCHDSRAKDANIRAALIDRYGGPAETKRGGLLHGVSKDVWAALACGLTYVDRLEEAA